MTLLEKILFLQKKMNLNDHQFSSRFSIKSGLFKKFKLGKAKLKEKDVLALCINFNLDVSDFLSDNSTLESTPKEGEHTCKIDLSRQTKDETILEDFAREDNSRYEEKD